MVLGSTSEICIKPEEHAGILASRDVILTLLNLEEKAELVVGNYLELESELLDISSRYLVMGLPESLWVNEQRSLINRRLINLLTSTRGYIDYALTASSSLAKPSVEDCKKRFAEHYDRSLGYRVMEALRNFSQHQGFPVHAITLSTFKREEDGHKTIATGIGIYTKAKYLAQGKKFKSSVLNEINQLGGRVDLKPLVRDYVSALTNVHHWLRAETGEELSGAKGTFEKLISRFELTFPGESTKGLVVATFEGANVVEEVGVFHEFSGYLEFLRKKHEWVVNLGRQYVTGETLEK